MRGQGEDALVEFVDHGGAAELVRRLLGHCVARTSYRRNMLPGSWWRQRRIAHVIGHLELGMEPMLWGRGDPASCTDIGKALTHEVKAAMPWWARR